MTHNESVLEELLETLKDDLRAAKDLFYDYKTARLEKQEKMTLIEDVAFQFEEMSRMCKKAMNTAYSVYGDLEDDED